MTQRTEVIFEMEETIVIRDVTAISKGFCPNCGMIVDMAPPHIVATISGGSEREIFRMIEIGEIHFVEAERIFVCLNSLNSFKEIMK